MNNFSFMDWVSMAEQLNPYITRHSAKRGMQWCKAHCHWSSVFSGVTNHVLSGNPNDESGFGGSQENGTYMSSVKFGVGLFYRSWACPLCSSERNS